MRSARALARACDNPSSLAWIRTPHNSRTCSRSPRTTTYASLRCPSHFIANLRVPDPPSMRFEKIVRYTLVSLSFAHRSDASCRDGDTHEGPFSPQLLLFHTSHLATIIWPHLPLTPLLSPSHPELDRPPLVALFRVFTRNDVCNPTGWSKQLWLLCFGRGYYARLQ